MQENELILTADDGLKLHGRVWQAEKPRAAVSLIHGLGEHSGRYDPIGTLLSERQISLCALDLRGHGLSEGRRGHVPSYEILMADISRFIEATRERFPDLPLFMYGQSLGGNIALTFVLKTNPDLRGVIVSAPLLKLAYEPPARKQKVLHLLQRLRINPALASGLDDTALSKDLNVIRSYRNDPLVHRVITPPLATQMLEAGKWCIENAAEFACPLLLIHGDADRITSAQATKEFALKTHCDCTLKIFPGLYHEPHNEPEKQAVFNTILTWLDQCMRTT